MAGGRCTLSPGREALPTGVLLRWAVRPLQARRRTLGAAERLTASSGAPGRSAITASLSHALLVRCPQARWVTEAIGGRPKSLPAPGPGELLTREAMQSTRKGRIPLLRHLGHPAPPPEPAAPTWQAHLPEPRVRSCSGPLLGARRDAGAVILPGFLSLEKTILNRMSLARPGDRR